LPLLEDAAAKEVHCCMHNDSSPIVSGYGTDAIAIDMAMRRQIIVHLEQQSEHNSCIRIWKQINAKQCCSGSSKNSAADLYAVAVQLRLHWLLRVGGRELLLHNARILLSGAVDPYSSLDKILVLRNVWQVLWQAFQNLSCAVKQIGNIKLPLSMQDQLLTRFHIQDADCKMNFETWQHFLTNERGKIA
jgi:hypothetical protein